MKKFLDDLTQSQLKLYREQPDRMISDFNHERELVCEYNGRQLLELLQNADDEGASKVLIELNADTQTLNISNTGNPFREKGFKSLMISNLSSKTKARFIGNKGLGFRSIVNWADKVTITSGGLNVEFSDLISKSVFNDSFTKEERDRIHADRGLTEESVPVAFLAIPRITECAPSEWATQIKINYREEFRDDIRSQMSMLASEILLFLNHITEIRIKDGDTERVISRDAFGDKVSISGDTWTIYEVTGELPDNLQDKVKAEREHYSLKLAITPNLDKASNKLFTFFPTKVNIDFPMVIHGTFDLDSSRNQLINTNKNKFILERLIELIIDTAKKLSGQDVSWKPVKLLRYKNKNPVLAELGFYQKIDKAVQELEIFPCIDNKYRKSRDAYYLAHEFSELILSTNNVEIFPELLVSDPDVELYRHLYRLANSHPEFEKKVNELSARLICQDIGFRVSLISLLSTLTSSHKFELLINDNGELIGTDNEVYTPITSSTETFALPAFVRIEFINRDLYQKLAHKFDLNSGEQARELQRKIKHITNIQSYEPAQVLGKIITSTNKELKDKPNQASDIISKMVVALYHNFIRLAQPPSLAPDLKIQLLARNLSVRDASDLYLGSGYPSGELTERLFCKVYRDDEFLVTPSAFGSALALENPEDLERFFLWLNVSQYVKYYVLRRKDTQYIEHVFSMVKRPASYRDETIAVLAIEEKNLDRIAQNLSREAIVMWIMNDPKAHNRLGLENADVFSYSKPGEYTGTHYHSLPQKPSYISFQLRRKALFNDFLIFDDSAINFINPFVFNYSHEIFESGSISRRDIEVVLSKLGGKDKFEDLSFERVFAILKGLPDTDPSGLHTQKIYKLALEHYKKHRKVLGTGLKLFAKRGSTQDYFQQNEVYYSDNVKLPQKIVDGKALLNFPRRAGTRQVVEYFSIHDLNDTRITVVNSRPIPLLSAQFRTLFEQLKPYILAYRIESLQKEKEMEASKLNRISFEFCSSLNCAVDDQEFSLAVNDYVNTGWRYFIRVEEDQTLAGLNQDSSFCDTFAEIICSAFMINELRAEFRSVFKNERSDVEHVVRVELGLEALNESRTLLGLSDSFVSFWSALHNAIDKPVPANISASDMPGMLVDLGLQDIDITDLDCSSLSTPKSVSVAQQIFGRLDISVERFNETAYYKISFADFHRNHLRNKLNELFCHFRSSLWRSLQNEGWEAKKQYLNGIAVYEHSGDWLDATASSLNLTLTADYDKLVKEFIQQKFHGLYLMSAQDFLGFYDDQSAQLSSIEIDSLPSDVKSLLYFPGGIEKIKEYFNALKGNDVDEELKKRTSASPLPKGSFSTKATPPNGDGGSSRKSPFKHSETKDRDNKKSGDAAETIVFNSLVAEYGSKFVEHASKRDDGLGYDIRYSPDGGQVWKFVEVKRYSSGRFFLSANERSFSERNIGSYEIFLVTSNDQIIPLRNIDFSDKENFFVTPNDYLVYFTVTEEVDEIASVTT